MKNSKNIDELIQGMELILSKDRYSFTDEEKALLQECKEKLQENKDSNEGINLELIVEVTKTLVNVFSLFKDYF